MLSDNPQCQYPYLITKDYINVRNNRTITVRLSINQICALHIINMIEGNVTAKIIQTGTITPVNKALIAYAETATNVTLTYKNANEFEMKKFNFTRNDVYMNYNLSSNRGLSLIGMNPSPN